MGLSIYIDTFLSENYGAYLVAIFNDEGKTFNYKVFQSKNEEYLTLLGVMDTLKEIEPFQDDLVIHLSNPYVLDLPNRMQWLKNRNFIDESGGREWTTQYTEKMYLYLNHVFPNTKFKPIEKDYVLLLKHLFRRKVRQTSRKKEKTKNNEAHSVRGVSGVR